VSVELSPTSAAPALSLVRPAVFSGDRLDIPLPHAADHPTAGPAPQSKGQTASLVLSGGGSVMLTYWD